MTFSRFMDGLNWVRDKTQTAFRILPPAAKVSAIVGAGIFNVDKFIGWALRVPSGLATPLGISLASVFFVGILIDATVGRGFNLWERTSPKPPAPPELPAETPPNETESDTIVPELSAKEIAKIANLWSPGMPSVSMAKNIGYKLFQLECALYIGNSAMGGYLSEFSIAQLVAKIPGLRFNSTCEDSHTAYSGIIAVHLAALYSSYSSILSYLKYNLIGMREYYIYYVIQDHWREIGFLSYLETFVGISINTISIIFSNKHTWELVETNSLCHIGAVPVPFALIQAQSWEACAANFVVNASSTLVAVHKRNTDVMKRELATLLEQVPACQRWDKLIRLCNLIAGLNAALGTVVATAKLPETINSDLEGLSYEWWMITLGSIAAVIACKNQVALSYESYIRQLEVWALKNATLKKVANETLSAPLLSDNSIPVTEANTLTNAEISGRDFVIDINQTTQHTSGVLVSTQSSFDGNSRTTITDFLSGAPSATLFGTSNPANPNQAKRNLDHINDVLIESRHLSPAC